MRSKTAKNSGSSSGRPLTLVKICTPFAPSLPMARSISSSEAGTLFIGKDATKHGKRCPASLRWSSFVLDSRHGCKLPPARRLGAHHVPEVFAGERLGDFLPDVDDPLPEIRRLRHRGQVARNGGFIQEMGSGQFIC